jgi:hypothetical protein
MTATEASDAAVALLGVVLLANLATLPMFLGFRWLYRAAMV